MDICPEMRELRSSLDRNGIIYEVRDDEYGILYENGSSRDVSVDSSIDGRMLDGFTHVERTLFRAPDGRSFDVAYIWTRDDDDRKVFLSLCGNFGYLEARVGESAAYPAYAEDVIEHALCHDA